jgi:hypothetical protein
MYLAITLSLSDSIIVTLKNIRFWLGIIIYLLLFKMFNPSKLITLNLFRLMVFFTICETILINLIVDPTFLYSGAGSENFLFYGFYYRPMSFAGNSSLSVSVLIAVFAAIDIKYDNQIRLLDWVLFIISVVLFNSGTGFIVLAAFLTYKVLSLKILNATYIIYLFFALLIIGYLINLFITYSSSLDQLTYQKISIYYYTHIQQLKFSQYVEYFENFKTSSNFLILFGNQLYSSSPNTTGDHGWLIMINTIGITGVILYFALIYNYKVSYNKMTLPIVTLFLATFHYPAAMSAAGQVILASFLLYNQKKNQ